MFEREDFGGVVAEMPRGGGRTLDYEQERLIGEDRTRCGRGCTAAGCGRLLRDSAGDWRTLDRRVIRDTGRGQRAGSEGRAEVGVGSAAQLVSRVSQTERNGVEGKLTSIRARSFAASSRLSFDGV